MIKGAIVVVGGLLALGLIVVAVQSPAELMQILLFLGGVAVLYGLIYLVARVLLLRA